MADIKAISSASGGIQDIGKDRQGSGQGNFTQLLREAIEKVNDLQREADKAIKEFAAGKASIHDTMIAIEKANLSFQLMVQVKRKIVSAYEEIIRMQI